MEIPNIINDIYGEFKHYFGEENVDLQTHDELEKYSARVGILGEDYNIIVHWDKVTISNERDESMDIYDFFCRIALYRDGSLASKPMFTKSTFTDLQWNNKYIHSHVSGISLDNWEGEFSTSCLGTGPLVHTTNLLSDNRASYTDMSRWMLLCVELDKYVHVESLEGRPYMYITKVKCNTYANNRSSNSTYRFNSLHLHTLFTSNVSISVLHRVHSPDLTSASTLVNSTIQTYIYTIAKYIHNSKLINGYSFINGHYDFSVPWIEILFDVSNSFIRDYNKDTREDKLTIEQLLDYGIMCRCITDGYSITIIKETSNTKSLDDALGMRILKFKGQDVLLKRHGAKINKNSNDEESTTLYVIDPKLFRFIASKYLLNITLRNGKPFIPKQFTRIERNAAII